MSKQYSDKENESRPYLAVNGIITKNINGTVHILLGKRKNSAGAGNYYVPGGHVKETETVPQALVREMKEEINLEVIPGKVLWIEENFTGPHHVIIYCEANLKDINAIPVNAEPNKCEGWDWYPIDNPPSPLWVKLGVFLSDYSSGKIQGIHLRDNVSIPD